jgi:hypothetical protein
MGGSVSDVSGGLRGLKYVLLTYIMGMELVLANGDVINGAAKR